MLAAGSVSVDRTTNQLSIFNIVEETSAVTFPAVSQFSVCALLSKTSKEANDPDLIIKVTLEGQEIFVGGFKGNFQDKNRTRVIVGLPPLVISAAGNLSVALHTKRTRLGAWTIKVNQLPSPSSLTATASPGGNLPSKGPLRSKKGKGRKAARKSRH